MRNKPIVGIISGTIFSENFFSQGVSEPNLNVLNTTSGCTPLIIPALGKNLDVKGVLNNLDGIYLPGGASNIHPENYNEKPNRINDFYDEKRDKTAIPLIKMAIKMGVPILSICRGFQELNVALGGTIHPYLHEISGKLDHRRDRTKSIEIQMRPTHSIKIKKNGLLHKISKKLSANVNSLHGQGINKLGKNLSVEAVADDSTIEAVSLKNGKGWLLGVQWHPEFTIEFDDLSKNLFIAYGTACKKRNVERLNDRGLND
tara:strand:- start:156 stop:932 length:777 start_codon:yes stop_codon:yes gene_type:complete